MSEKIQFSSYSVKKSEKVTLKIATERAIKAMQTDEGNLVCSETETHYKFKRSR